MALCRDYQGVTLGYFSCTLTLPTENPYPRSGVRVFVGLGKGFCKPKGLLNYWGYLYKLSSKLILKY